MQTRRNLSTMLEVKQSPKNHFKILFALFLANLIWLNGCGGGENTNSNQRKTPATANSNSNKPSDKIEELREFILLPEEPEEVVWKEEPLGNKNSTAPGPTDKKIIAVLQYTVETAPKLLAIIEKNKQPEQVEIGVEDWFPEELKAQARLSGMEMLKGTAYGANQFYNLPYGNGKITRIEGTNYFVLELFTT